MGYWDGDEVNDTKPEAFLKVLLNRVPSNEKEFARFSSSPTQWIREMEPQNSPIGIPRHTSL